MEEIMKTKGTFKPFLAMLLIFSVIMFMPLASSLGEKTEFDKDKPIKGQIDIVDNWGLPFISTKKASYLITDWTDQCLANDCYGLFTVTMFKDGKAFDGMKFKDKKDKKDKEKNNEFRLYSIEENGEEYQIPTYEIVCNDVWIEGNETNSTEGYYQEQCSQVENGYETKYRESKTLYDYKSLEGSDEGIEYKFRLEVTKGLFESVDAIPIAQGIELSEWAWFNSSWTKKRELTNITNSFITYFNITYDSGMQSDFEDIRFLNGAEDTELNYTLEEKVDGEWADFRVGTNNESSVYMYYGNDDATYNGNFNDTYFDPVSYYYMDEASGTIIDWAGINDGTNTGADYGIAGKIRTALDFETTESDNVDCGTATNTGFSSSDFSVSVWFKPESSVGGQGLVTRGAYNQDGWSILVGEESFDLFLSQSGKRHYIYYAGTVDIGSWNYFTVTRSGGTINVYKNNTLLTPSASANNLVGTDLTYSPTRHLFIGQRDLDDKSFDGLIEEVGIYDKVLTSDQRESLYLTTQPSGFLGAEESIVGISTALNSPADSLETATSEITFNCSAVATGGTQISNITLYTWGSTNFTNVTSLSGTSNSTTWTNTLSDGIWTWNCYSQGDGGEEDWATNRTLTVDTTSPTFILNVLNNVSTLTVPVNNTFNITSSDTHLSICKYSTSENSTNITYTCNANQTILFQTGGTKTITVYANDTFGNENQTDYSFNIYDFSVTQSGSSSSADGSSETFTLLINSTSLPIEDADGTLWYNGINYVATKTVLSANAIQLSKILVIPDGTGNSTGKDISWLWNYNATHLTARNTSTQTQTVYNVSISDCEVVGGRVILNLTLRDEELNTYINQSNEANIELDLSIVSLVNSSKVWGFDKKWTNSNNVTVCVPDGLLNTTSYEIDFTIGYDSIDHVREFYFLEDGTLDNTTSFNSYTDNTISLMDILSADSTTFLFSFTDTDGLDVDDAIVHTFRKYIGEGLFREVERSKQDNNGDTHVHLVEEDVIYYFMVTQYGEIIYTSDSYNAKCLATPCAISLSASSGDVNWSLIDDETGSQFAVTSDKDTRITSLSFLLDSSDLVNLSVYSYNGDDETLINTSSLTSQAGSIDLHIPVSYGNETFFAVIYENNTFIQSTWIDLTERGRDYFGTTGVIFGGLIVMAMMFMAISEGIGFIIFTILALFVVVIMKLIDMNWMALISIICAGGIIIFKLVNGRRKQ